MDPLRHERMECGKSSQFKCSHCGKLLKQRSNFWRPMAWPPNTAKI